MSSVRPAEDDRAVFEAAPDGILIVDSDGVIARANPQALQLFGYESETLVGQPIEVLVPAPLRDVHQGHRRGYVRSPHTRPMGIGLELEGVRKDGVAIPVEISLSPLGTDGDMIIAIVRDLSERRRLKGFGIAALNAAEEERRRIARELHDETAQALAALLMNLTVFQKRLAEDPLADEVATLRARVTEIVEGVRRIARGLRPPELEDVGLAVALRSFLRGRFAQGHVHVEFDGSESRLSAHQSLVVYRIAQEAISNAVRHGRASSVRLSMREAEGSEGVVLHVDDDGVGFDPDRVHEPDRGLGLVGMEERAQIAGGRLEIRSKIGEGTSIRLEVPTAAPAPPSGRSTGVGGTEARNG